VFEKNVDIANWHLPRRFSILWGIQLTGLNITILLLMYSLGTKEIQCESMVDRESGAPGLGL
jgi:hypothetical protein